MSGWRTISILFLFLSFFSWGCGQGALETSLIGNSLDTHLDNSLDTELDTETLPGSAAEEGTVPSSVEWGDIKCLSTVSFKFLEEEGSPSIFATVPLLSSFDDFTAEAELKTKVDQDEGGFKEDTWIRIFYLGSYDDPAFLDEDYLRNFMEGIFNGQQREAVFSQATYYQDFPIEEDLSINLEDLEFQWKGLYLIQIIEGSDDKLLNRVPLSSNGPSDLSSGDFYSSLNLKWCSVLRTMMLRPVPLPRFHLRPN